MRATMTMVFLAVVWRAGLETALHFLFLWSGVWHVHGGDADLVAFAAAEKPDLNGGSPHEATQAAQLALFRCGAGIGMILSEGLRVPRYIFAGALLGMAVMLTVAHALWKSR